LAQWTPNLLGGFEHQHPLFLAWNRMLLPLLPHVSSDSLDCWLTALEIREGRRWEESLLEQWHSKV